MNIKKILVLLLFFVAIACILTPVTGKVNADVDIVSLKNVNGNSQLSLSVDSDIGMKSKKWYGAKSVSKRKAELNNIKKVVVEVKGKKKVTFKKPNKSWKIYKFDYSFNKLFSVKGKVESKTYSIKLYNKKNKLIKNKKSKLKFSSTIGSMSEVEIENDPTKYFNELKSKNKKDKYYNSKDYKELGVYFYSNYYRYENLLNTSSSVSYYYNSNSMFSNQDKIFRYCYTYLAFKTKKMESSKTYVKGDYKLTIQTVQNSEGIFKHIYLYKNVNETRSSSVKNPYFSNSIYCDWTNPSIISLAESIKATVPSNANIDIYRYNLSNAVIKYLHLNIAYDYSFSTDQSALTTLQRGSGTCLGNAMLAGALLRYLGIPTYFETSSNVSTPDETEESHIWVVSYLFYDGKYQWVPADPTHDYTKNPSEYKLNQFYIGATNWWIVNHNGIYNRHNGYAYYYDLIEFGEPYMSLV